MKKANIEINKKYGRLTILNDVENNTKKYRVVLAKCDCGTIKEFNYMNIKRGKSISCGCFRKEKISLLKTTNGAQSKLASKELRQSYARWKGMRNRCYLKTHPKYANYGGRGITVCDSWLNSFDEYLKDVGDRPTEFHSIDRINNNGNYEPSNVRWATTLEQSRNTTTNKNYFYNGEKICQKDLIKKIGVSIYIFKRHYAKKLIEVLAGQK